VAPGNFGAALVVLYAFHALSMLYLYRTLLLLEPRVLSAPSARTQEPLRLLQEPASWLLFGLFYVNVFVGSLFMWWTAGLHRLPFVAFSCVSAYYYLRYRRSGSTRHGLACAGAVVLALGFYTKGVLVPWYLLGVELCLWPDTRRDERRRNLALVAALVAGTALYAGLWSLGQPAVVQAINSDWHFQLQYVIVSWKVFQSGIVGHVFRSTDKLTLAAVAASLVTLAVVARSTLKRPSVFMTWLALFGFLLVNVGMVSLSKHRTGAYGLLIPLFSDRYYYELLFVVVLFAAVALERSGPSTIGRWTHQGSLRGWFVAVAVAASVIGVAATSYASLERDARRTFTDYRKARQFVHNVQRDSRRLRVSDEPLHIVEGLVPPYIVMFPPEYCHQSSVLRALGVPALVSAPGPDVYRLLPSGQIVPSEP
jgi:hypothetical protein